MNRSPLFYPLNRGGDAEAGGAADLQTDIMRFMAILALCLVAIFALVQSIPLTPTVPDEVPSEPEPETMAAQPPPEAAPARSVKIPQPVSEPRRAVPAKPFSAVEPAPARTQPKASAPESESPQAEPEPDEGFTLRFSSDHALTRLVARSEVDLYAMAADDAVRMTVSGNRYSFWPASTPNQYHEMDESTVPAAVVAALRRSGLGIDGDDVRWGVTLPANMRRQLDTYLSGNAGGEIVIESDGNLRLEQ
ncbi:MAG: hypothetical protein ACN4GT_02935 [Gammaproteobacteria bacterium]